jgi:hypothetical protein
MKWAILAIRIVEIFLLVMVVERESTLEIKPTGEWVFTNSNNIYQAQLFEFSIAADTKRVVLSSAAIGYMVSLIGTLLQGGKKHRAWWVASLVLSLLGLVSFLNEGRRFMEGTAGLESFQFLVSLPPLLIAVDWVMFALMMMPDATAAEAKSND